jgi:hypothetical protein
MDILKDNLSVVCIGIMLIAMAYLAYTKGEEHKANMTPEERLRQENCLPHAVRSRPSCWKEVDWKAFCAHVQCKE